MNAQTPTEHRHWNRTYIIGIILITLATLGTWLFLWRDVYLSYDDIRASLNGGAEQFGASTPKQIWQAAMNDYRERNGRVADALVKALIGLGHRSWQITSPIILTLMSASTFYFVAQLRKAASPDAVATPRQGLLTYGAVSAIPLGLVAANEALGPQLFFFNAAVVGYAGALAMGALAVGLLITRWRSPLTTWVAAIFSWLLLFVTALTNESATLAALFVLMVTLFLKPLRQNVVQLSGGAAVTAVGFTVHFFAPGRIARTEDVSTLESSLFVRLARGMFSIPLTGGFLLALSLVVALLLLGFSAFSNSGSRLAVSVAVVLGWCGVAAWWVSAMASDGIDGAYGFLGSNLAAYVLYPFGVYGFGTLTLVALGAVGMLGVACAMFFLMGRSDASTRNGFLVVIALVAGSAAVPMYTGLHPGRPWFFVVYFGVVLPWTMLAGRGGRDRSVESWDTSAREICSWALMAVTVSLAIYGAHVSEQALSEVAAVWVPGEQQLFEVAVGRSEVDLVVLPGPDKYENELWSRLVPRSSGLADALREWYAIPDDVQLEWR